MTSISTISSTISSCLTLYLVLVVNSNLICDVGALQSVQRGGVGVECSTPSLLSGASSLNRRRQVQAPSAPPSSVSSLWLSSLPSYGDFDEGGSNNNNDMKMKTERRPISVHDLLSSSFSSSYSSSSFDDGNEFMYESIEEEAYDPTRLTRLCDHDRIPRSKRIIM